jgi:hypothetical protein
MRRHNVTIYCTIATTLPVLAINALLGLPDEPEHKKTCRLQSKMALG